MTGMMLFKLAMQGEGRRVPRRRKTKGYTVQRGTRSIGVGRAAATTPAAPAEIGVDEIGIDRKYDSKVHLLDANGRDDPTLHHHEPRRPPLGMQTAGTKAAEDTEEAVVRGVAVPLPRSAHCVTFAVRLTVPFNVVVTEGLVAGLGIQGQRLHQEDAGNGSGKWKNGLLHR